MGSTSLAIYTYNIFSEFHRKKILSQSLAQSKESSLSACLFSPRNEGFYEPSHLFCSDVCFLLHLLKSCELFLQNLSEGGRKQQNLKETWRDVKLMLLKSIVPIKVITMWQAFTPGFLHQLIKFKLIHFFSLFITCLL